MIGTIGLISSLVAGLSAAEQELSTAVDEDDLTVIEEILVTAVDRCGPWPIAHESIDDCVYPELKRDQLHRIRTLRDKYLDTCLSCTDSSCRPRSLPVGARRQKYMCRRLFQSPRRVPRTQIQSVAVGYLVVDFIYDITARGRATDIRILWLDSDVSQDIVLELITEAAAEVRFEPIRHGGKRVPLMGVEESYILDPW